jgi:arginine/lysine/histidine transporter system substrate-binding protein
MKKSLYLIITLIAAVTALIWYNAKKVAISQPLDTIIIGTNAEFQPFAFKEDDAIVGFDIDIITEVFKRLNKNIIIKDMPFDALIPEIQLGNIHVIAGGITPTPERAKRALFTKPHLTGGKLIIVSLKKNPPVADVHDLQGKEVVVNEGYTADSYMSAQPGVFLSRLSSSSVSTGILALKSDRAYAFVTALQSIQPYFNAHGTDDFNITPIKDTDESSAFAVSKYYPELRDYIQIILDQMEADGTLAALKKKWNLL